jgi:A/G-specific adenine glycosylase
VLLQRTRAETVAAIYPTFFGRFTSWQVIADADIGELEKAFKPIGLWQRRARSIKALATYAAACNGVFPSTQDELAHVPAVGQYVANAILLFQHGQPSPLIDVNMARLIERYLRPRRLADIRYDPWLQAASRWLVRGADPIRVNWATLDLAHAYCQPRKPKCADCILRKWCNTGKVNKTS